LTCPHCKVANQSVVVASRAAREKIWRRRKCHACKERFTTYETVTEASKPVAPARRKAEVTA
jgi:transcriptional regulator NrdR family protein